MRPSPLGKRRLGLLLAAGTALCCSTNKPPQGPPDQAAPLGVPDEEEASDQEGALPRASGRAWAGDTFSPRPGAVPDPELEELVAACGQSDAALHEVASFVAEVQGKTGEPPNIDVVNFELKRRGSPYVMPRLWAASASGSPYGELAAHVARWAKTRPARGSLRCGAGSFTTKGELHVAALQVDVVAELSPLATQIDAGSWLELEARFLVPTTATSVVLLPPDGPPRTVQATLEGDRARARLSLPTAGTWLVQLMATQAGGPLPVASALVTAGRQPPDAFDDRPVPGEGSYDAKLAPADALLVLVNAARKDAGLPVLRRNTKLDQLALEHSHRMDEKGQISHDTGHGDPGRRVTAAGLTPKATGENVALAGSVPRLHRALWASPSHRENLLLRRWDEIGIGIVRRDDGSYMVTQLFIDSN